MRVLFCAAELSPIVRVGGVAEGLLGLSRALARTGHEVTVALPLPPGQTPDAALFRGKPEGLGLPSPFGAGEIAAWAADFEAGIRVLLVEIPGAPLGLGVYGLEGDGEIDNGRRFGAFSRAVARLGGSFDVVHAHDWPGAAGLYLLRSGGASLRGPKTVLTLHNLAFQGVFPPEALDALGLDSSAFHPGALEFYGRLNLLKAGILAADVVTTVSPRHALEILDPAFGQLLDGVLRQRPGGVVGILNGIDLFAWDPRVDPALEPRYGPEQLDRKIEHKRAFLSGIGLPADPLRPLVLSLGRIVEQKGSDLVAASVPRLASLGATVVVAGAGEAALEARLRDAARLCRDRSAFIGRLSGTDVKRAFAAADILLMPSRFEPCGVVQMEARRYGVIPVARRTGGLADTILDEDERPGEGTGFLFDEPTADALVAAASRAIASFRSPAWLGLSRRAMLLAPGWERPANAYASLYRRIPSFLT